MFGLIKDWLRYLMKWADLLGSGFFEHVLRTLLLLKTNPTHTMIGFNGIYVPMVWMEGWDENCCPSYCVIFSESNNRRILTCVKVHPT